MKYWLFILVLLPSVASAGAYKCMDGGGQTVYSSTPCEDEGLMPYVDNRVAADGTVVLHMDVNHSYRTPGTLNGATVTFVVDTRAPHTAMSQSVATAAGIQGCDSHAGGRCSVRVHEITFGGIELSDVPVEITPSLAMDVQLGHDALQHLKVKEANGTLYLSRR